MPDDTLVQQDTLDTSTTRDTINLNNGGVPLLNEDGKIYNEYLPTITGAVTSVNGQTGNVIVNAGDVSYNSTTKKLTYNQGANNVDELNIGSAVSLSNGVITTNDLRSSTATISSNITTPKIYGGSSSSSSLTLQPTSNGSTPESLSISESYGSTGINILSSGSLTLGSDGSDLNISSDADMHLSAVNNVDVQCGGTFLYRDSEVLTRDSIASADTPNKLNINKYNSSGYMPSGASGTAPDMSNSMTNMGFYVAAYYPLGNNVFRIWLSDKQQEMLLADDADGSGFTNKAGNAASISYETSESNLETSVEQFAAKIQGYYQSATNPHPEVYFTFYNNPQCENGIRACSENQDFWRDISGIRTAIIVEAVFTGSNKGFPPERYTVNELKGDPWRYGLVVSTPINPVTVSGSNVDFQSLGLVDFTLIAAVVGHNNRLLSIGTYAVGKEHSVLGMYSSAFGRANTVYTYCSLASGQGNTTTCEKSFISGTNNTLNHGINSAALGRNNTVIGSETPADQTSNFAIGTYNSVTNTTTNTSSFAIGNYIVNTVSTKLSVGKYNYDNPNNIFEVGCGSGDANRKNVFEVHSNGNLVSSGYSIISGSTEPSGIDYAVILGKNNSVSISSSGHILLGRSNTSSSADGGAIGNENSIVSVATFALGASLVDNSSAVRNKLLIGSKNDPEDLTTGIGTSSDYGRFIVGVGQTGGSPITKTGLMVSSTGNLWLGGSIINMLGSDNNRYRLSIDVTGGTPTLVITPVA